MSVDPLPSEPDLESHYKSDYYVANIYHGGIGDWMVQKPLGIGSKRWPWSNWAQLRAHRSELCRLTKLRGMLPDSSTTPRFLDVGCGTGESLAAVRDLQWTGLGIEASRGAAQHARQRSGMEVLCTTFDQAPVEAGSFDIVQLRDVLEHVRAPRRLLERTFDWLRPGGVFYVQVPNDLESYRRYMPGRPWWLFPPVHLHYFRLSVLSDALRRVGFQVQLAGSLGDAVGMDVRRYIAWHCGLLSLMDRVSAKGSLASLGIKLFQVGWDHLLFWPAKQFISRTMRGFVFWIVARKPHSPPSGQAG